MGMFLGKNRDAVLFLQAKEPKYQSQFAKIQLSISPTV